MLTKLKITHADEWHPQFNIVAQGAPQMTKQVWTQIVQQVYRPMWDRIWDDIVEDLYSYVVRENLYSYVVRENLAQTGAQDLSELEVDAAIVEFATYALTHAARRAQISWRPNVVVKGRHLIRQQLGKTMKVLKEMPPRKQVRESKE